MQNDFRTKTETIFVFCTNALRFFKTMSAITIYNAKREPLVINLDNVQFVKQDDCRVALAFVGERDMTFKFVSQRHASDFCRRVFKILSAKAAFYASGTSMVHAPPRMDSNLMVADLEECTVGQKRVF